MGVLEFSTFFTFRGPKDKVCQSLCGHSKLNSTFLLKIFFWSTAFSFHSSFHEYVHKYEAVLGYFVATWILINYFLLTYKVGINYAPIINRSNHLSENVFFFSKNDKIITEIFSKSLGTKKDKKSNTYGLVK